MALRGEIVDLVRLHFLDDADQRGGVGEVAVMQGEVEALLVRIVIQMIDAIGVEQAGAPLYAMHLIALAEQQFFPI